MQPQQYIPNNRQQRPLQKSMFLPQTQQYIQRNNTLDYQYQDAMKRSLIQPDNSLKQPANNFQQNPKQNSNFIETQKQQQQNFQFPNYTQTPQSSNQYNTNAQILNFSNGIRYKDNPRLGQFQHQPIVQTQINQPLSSVSQSNLLPASHSLPQLILPQMPNTQFGVETVLQQLQQKVNQLTQLVESHDEIIKKSNLSTQVQPQKQLNQQLLLEQLAEQLQARLKQQIIPTIISKQTKQIYQHIFDLKLEIKTIRQEISGINDNFKNQISTALSLNKSSSSTLNSAQKIQKVNDETIVGLNVNNSIAGLESKLVEMEKNLIVQNDEFKAFLLTELQKVKKQPKSHQFSRNIKSSTIKSTLSPILIEYREIFSIKSVIQKQPITRMSVHNSPKREQKQITINSSTYFIDRQGYLLDNQNRYIIDQKGHQIKLDQKHLSLLKEHNVLT